LGDLRDFFQDNPGFWEIFSSKIGESFAYTSAEAPQTFMKKSSKCKVSAEAPRDHKCTTPLGLLLEDLGVGLRRGVKIPYASQAGRGTKTPLPPFHWRLGIFTRIPKRQKIKVSSARRPCCWRSEKVSEAGEVLELPLQKSFGTGDYPGILPAAEMLLEDSSEAPLPKIGWS